MRGQAQSGRYPVTGAEDSGHWVAKNQRQLTALSSPKKVPDYLENCKAPFLE